MLALLNGSKSMIECGTSFGVSTIYMALAARKNAEHRREDVFGVLTLEKDSSKIFEAKRIWREAGSEVEGWIESREGDLLDLLEQEQLLPPVVDLLFLDGKYSSDVSFGAVADSS
jgi:predicted O-methyltransferase YrrM